MADEYYVLDSSGRSTSIVIRVDTPGGSNRVGMSWTTVLAERWDNLDAEDRTTQFPGKNINQLANGSQHETLFRFKANVARPGIVTELEAAVAAQVAVEKIRIQSRYDFWGKTGVV